MKKKDIKKFIILITSLIAFQCLIYFLTKLLQNNFHLLESTFDNFIPFIPHFVYFYILWYLLLIIIPFLLFKKDKNMFAVYYISYALSVVIAGVIFVIYPTTIDRPMIKTINLTTYLVNLIYKLDSPAINLLPSMHCLFCFFFIFSTFKNKNIKKKYQISIFIISLLIIASTVFIKQHILIDIIASLIIATFCFIITKHTKLVIKFQSKLN